MSNEEASEDNLYAVWAEAAGHDAPLLQVGMSFARLMDDIVVPYQGDTTFFIDGAPVTPSKLKRIKLLRLRPSFARARGDFTAALTQHGNPAVRKTYGEQYGVRMEHMLRENAEDVTAQVIKAFNQASKPRLTNYIPKREELIQLAKEGFIEAVKRLGT